MALIKTDIGLRTTKMNKDIQVFNKWIHVGYSWRSFGLGFRFSQYNIDVDFLWFWIGIEL